MLSYGCEPSALWPAHRRHDAEVCLLEFSLVPVLFQGCRPFTARRVSERIGGGSLRGFLLTFSMKFDSTRFCVLDVSTSGPVGRPGEFRCPSILRRSEAGVVVCR